MTFIRSKILRLYSVVFAGSIFCVCTSSLEGKQVVTVMTGTPVCTKEGVQTYAKLYLANLRALKASNKAEIYRTNRAIGDVQNKMCDRVPCCADVSGVLIGNQLRVEGMKEPFLEVIVKGAKGYILEEDIMNQ